MPAPDFLDKAFVISLGRQGQRYRDFIAHNSGTGLEYVYFEGVNGKELGPFAAVEEGIITPGSMGALTNGAIGNAWTHRNLWRKIMTARKPALVFEDDAILRRDIRKRLGEIIPQLPRDWEILLLGYNTDAHLSFDILPGMKFTGTFEPRYPSMEQLGVFAREATPVMPMKLRLAFGICAYLISPKGAEALSNACFPLDYYGGVMTGARSKMLFASLDFKMTAIYGMMQAYACVGPLALSPNDQAGSMTARPEASG